MTKIIGLTGGIGSGKSTVAAELRKLGIPVYVADDEGRKITESPAVKSQIQEVFNDAFDGEVLNRKKLASMVFNNKSLLNKLNAIIHPAVKTHFLKWLESQKDEAIVVKEAAILFESGTYSECDFIITVTAPYEERISRVMKRDMISRQEVVNRIENQISDSERISKSDFVIDNPKNEEIASQIEIILKKISIP